MEEKLFTEAEIGSTLKRPVLVTAINESVARNGSTFLKITMKDGVTDQVATMFNQTAAELEKNKGVVKNCIANVELSVGEYQGSKSFKITDISVCTDPSVSMSDFIRLPPVDTDRMYQEICELLNKAANSYDGKFTPLSDLTLRILDSLKERYMTSSAAVAMHHNLKGGLLYHSYRMAKAADMICDLYSLLDRELLISGAVLHDIGKLWEYKTSDLGEAEYTSSGILFGHLYLGASLIKKYTENQNYSMEKVQMLIHIILSHHGTREWGAVTCPAIAEAMALHYIDNLDAKLYTFEEQYQLLQPGEFTDRKPFGFENRIYRPKF